MHECNLCSERGLLTNSSCISKTCLLPLLNFFVQLFSRSLLYLCLSEPRDRSSATLLNASWQKSHFCTEQLKSSSRVLFYFFNFASSRHSEVQPQICLIRAFVKWPILLLFEIRNFRNFSHNLIIFGVFDPFFSMKQYNVVLK